jgi:hypothetical protein
VHIIDDKLRINFSRCLDLVSNAIASQMGGGSNEPQEHSQRDGSAGRDSQGRIIMILDGLENFRDNEND